jgi:hypothetical protein
VWKEEEEEEEEEEAGTVSGWFTPD